MLLFFLWFLSFLFCHCFCQKESMQLIYSTALLFAPIFLSSITSHLQTSFALLSICLPDFLLLHLLSEKVFHNSCTCFYLIQRDFLKPINTSDHSPIELIFYGCFCCHWGSSSPRSNGQSFLSLTSLLLAFIIELWKYWIRTWFHFTSYCIKTAFPYLQGLPRSFINFSG